MCSPHCFPAWLQKCRLREKKQRQESPPAAPVAARPQGGGKQGRPPRAPRVPQQQQQQQQQHQLPAPQEQQKEGALPLPGMVPLAATGGSPSTAAPAAAVPVAPAAPPATANSTPAAGPPAAPPFADPTLECQAAAWRVQQAQLQAQLSVLAQRPAPHGAPDQLQAAAAAALHREHLQCLQALISLHLVQMQRHLAAAAGLQDQPHPEAPTVHVEVQELQPARLPSLHLLRSGSLGAALQPGLQQCGSASAASRPATHPRVGGHSPAP